MRPMVKLVFLAVLPAWAAGCGSGAAPVALPDAKERLALNDVGELYRIYQLRTKKAPKSPKDLEASEMGGPAGLRAIRNKDVVVRWGAILPDLGEEPGVGGTGEVLAYEKKVSEQGGLVLMLDRTVKPMTAEEFQSAKLAGTGSSDVEEAKGKGKPVKKKG